MDMRNIMILGVGGQGVNALSRVHDIWADPPPYAGVDTDAQQLESAGLPRFLLLGRAVAEGMGAGSDAEIGEQCALSDEVPLRDLLIGHDLVILVAGMGGGTGAGAAPVIAEMAAGLGAVVMAVVTMPFYFEGAGKRKSAERGLARLKQAAGAVVVLPNQRMFDWVNDQTSMAEAFGRSDAVLINHVCLFAETLQSAGIMNTTVSDVRNLVRHSGGACVMGYGESRDAGRAAAAVEQLLENPVLGGENVIPKAAGLMLCIMGGEDLKLSEVELVVNSVTELARPDAHLFIGTALREDWRGRMAVALLAAEHWTEPPADVPAPVEDEETEPERVEMSSGKSRRRSRSARSSLVPEGRGEGRFKNTEPTLYRGEDLDQPTYRRKGIQLLS